MELTVQKREKFGKQVNTLRGQGLIPAELYGHGIENIHLAVPAKDFQKIFKQAGESTLLNIVIGSDKRPAMIHDISRDPVTEEITSVDFYQVRLDEKIKVKVPLNFAGEAPAIKEKGGLLVKSMHEIEVEALPGSIPHAIDVDISVIKEIGQSVRVNDLKFPSGVKAHVAAETVVATVTEKPTEEEITAPAAEASVESVKVETEEKKVERAAKKAATEMTGEAAKDKPEAKK